jgi:VWFA-related protein
MHGGMMTAMSACLAVWASSPAVGASWTQAPTFRVGVERVAISATVRTPRGRPVTGLAAADFQLIDSGRPRRIVEFRADESAIRIALLVDFSGSMDVAAKRAEAAEGARHVLSWLRDGRDEVSLFGFDRRLRELHPPTTRPADVFEALDDMQPWGETSLFDAIAETGQRIADWGDGRRAIVALTDGSDNASRLTAPEVSGIASAIDVPVYIVVIVSPLERAGRTTIDDEKYEAMLGGKLGDLARWTGGEIYAALNPALAGQAARQIVTELRHQYLIAFEPDTRPGWHPIELRTRNEDFVVRTRSGYVVPGRPDDE